MRKVALLLLVSVLFTCLKAQVILGPEVIASGGDYFVTSFGSLSWTLGEPIVETVQNSSINIILTQGFQQPDTLIFTGIENVDKSSIFVSLYPNPTTQMIKMELTYDNNSEIRIDLIDMLGQTMHSDKIDVVNGNVSNYELDVSTLASGMYMFRLTDNSQLINSYKFQKTGL